MFYLLSKVVSFALTPAGWLLALLVGAVLTKNARRRRGLTIGALALFWLLGNRALVSEVARWWEGPPAPLPPASAGNVVVVLTGGITNAHKRVVPPRPLLATQADRAGQALWLYRQRPGRKILISGGSTTLPFVPKDVADEGRQVAKFLQLAGVPPADIVLENRSRNTVENARFSARVLRRRFQTNRCILVTSALHMRRARACFGRQGIQATPVAGVYVSEERSWAPGGWLLPQEQALTDAHYVIREIIGYVTYRLMGYC